MVDTKKKESAALSASTSKLQGERDRANVLASENNDLRNTNTELAAQLSAARDALEEKNRSSADAIEVLRVQLGDAHGRLDSLGSELEQIREKSAGEREQAASALASKENDQETIRALRDQSQTLTIALARIREALRSVE